MIKKSYLETLLEEFEDDFEFKVDGKILDITETICEIMNQNGIRRADLSRRLKTSKSAVTKMLNGSSNFTLKSLMKIAIALDKDLDISFTEPKAMNFNVPKENESASIQTENDDWGTWNDLPSHRPLDKKEEPTIAETA